MLVLASGDSLRGSASVAAVVDYSFHGLAGSTLALLAEGQLPVTDNELYLASAVVVVKSVVIVNTHTSAVTINLTILKAASTARKLLPKDLSLPAGYMAIFDGSRFSVFDTSGNLLTLIGDVTGLSGLLADDQHVLDAEVLAVAAALVHASRHQDAGADEISVTGLSGLLADDQHVLDAEVLAVAYDKSLVSAAGAALIDDANAAAQRVTLGAGFPKFSAHKNGTNQTGVVTSTWTKVTFTTEEYDVGSAYNAANSKWIPGIVGKGQVLSSIMFLSPNDGMTMAVTVYKNGVLYKQATLIASGVANQGGSVVFNIFVEVVTDYFEIYVLHDSTTNKDIHGNAALTWFMGHMLL